MNVREHIETARYFLAESKREFAAGDDLKGSRKMWDAAECAVSAVALARGWEHSRHEDLFAAASMLSAESDDSEFVGGFVVAEKFRENME